MFIGAGLGKILRYSGRKQVLVSAAAAAAAALEKIFECCISKEAFISFGIASRNKPR